MGRQRAAGAKGRIAHLIPLRRIVEGAEQYPPDQRQVPVSQRRPENRRVLRHESERTEFDAGVSGSLCFIQHVSPKRIARIVRELHAPRAGSITNRKIHQ